MNIHFRLKRLEGRLGVGVPGGPPCAICHAQGQPGLELTRSSDSPGVVRGGCPGCRRVSVVARMVLAPVPGRDAGSDPWEEI